MLKPSQVQELLGYLNFSSGTPDPQFLRNLDGLFAAVERPGGAGQRPWRDAAELLRQRLAKLAGSEAAFRDSRQAAAVVQLAFDDLPQAYRAFHRDLLYHQSDAELFGPWFIGRACEAVLEQGPPWDEHSRIVDGAIDRLNDFLGHRPVAVLRTAQRIEPYPHERVRPLPLYVRGAGVVSGRYQEVVTQALEILRATNPAVLQAAQFDLDVLDELALDSRAYDFDHPVNKRPNYHFGQWDPHRIDNQGYYRRFVVQQVTIDVLLERLAEEGPVPRDQLLVEAAAVLAGTILMASGTSGGGPDAYDSTTTLSTLLPRIAAYRDAFYDQFIERLEGPHAQRLQAEATAGKQPLAGARQHLNQQLARRRAAQLEHVHLSRLFARMGYPDAALRQAQIVPVASARIECEMQCRLTTGHLAIDSGDLARASALLEEIEDYLHRAIECGALIDPWNILGFQGQFSLFPSPENSVPDHRLEQLIDLMEQIVGLYARLWSEAAVRNDARLETALAQRMAKLTTWWDAFAPTSVDSIEAFSGAEAYDSAREVAAALQAFQQAGGAAGNIAFWRTRVAHFNSPKAYALVVGALGQKPDPMAAMALLVQWLSSAGLIELEQGEYSFYGLAERWLADVSTAGSTAVSAAVPDRTALVVKFFDLLEANADDYWQVPTLELLAGARDANLLDDLEDEDASADDESNLYSAAYENVVYIDSTGDGLDADMLESGPAPATDFELEQEARRVGQRLLFLRAIAALWKRAVLALSPPVSTALPAETLLAWLDQATANQRNLLALLRSIHSRRISSPDANRDALVEFDRRRAVKEALLEKVVGTMIETAAAARAMRAALPEDESPSPDRLFDDVQRAAARGDADAVRRLCPPLLEHLAGRALLYQPIGKGGDPARLIQARSLHHYLRDLLSWLPKLGLLGESCQLLEAARLMESTHPVGAGAISEYDRLFAVGYETLVESLVSVSAQWPGGADTEAADNALVECLEQLTESLLKQWLAHSRTLRLSVLERLGDEESWLELRKFVERYGHDLFTQRFLNVGNLRAILHQGADHWLDSLAAKDRRDDEEQFHLLDDLGENISRADAVKHSGLVIEAVLENYAAYRDYNSTTTQSDRGEMLYTFLDFLRLRVQYDRVVWHLKPVMIAHDVLVRRGRSAAAEMWRRALAERTAELADTLQKRYAELRASYSMRLPTVSDRLAERFVRPLSIDRVRALVKPAMEAVRRGGSTDTPSVASPDPFELLEQETAQLTQEPTGVGLEVPDWLASLEREVAGAARSFHAADREEPALLLDQAPLTVEEVQRQLAAWHEPGK